MKGLFLFDQESKKVAKRIIIIHSKFLIYSMVTAPLHLLFANNDVDDHEIFNDALNDLQIKAALTVADGAHLMHLIIADVPPQTDKLFPNINMPLKNGHVCLEEIKMISHLETLPVTIYSAASNLDTINLLKSAFYYTRKPGNFSLLKQAFGHAIDISTQVQNTQPSKEQFILSY